MNSEMLIQAIEAAGLQQHVGLAKELVKRGVKLVTEPAKLEALPAGSSYLGGIPDLPPGASWPTCDDVPMEFVAQIALRDLEVPDEPDLLPRTGHLCFFRSTQWEWSDFLEGDAVYELAHVVHVDQDNVERAEPPYQSYSDEFVTDVTAPRVYQPVKIRFEPTVTLPSYASAFAPEGKTEVLEELEGVLYQLQGEDYKAHHMFTHTAEGDFVGAMGRDDVLLLQLMSDDDAGFTWGDLGVLYFVTERAALARGDFGKVRVYNVLG